MRETEVVIAPADSLDLPPSWTAAAPGPDDVPDLHALLERHVRAARGTGSAPLDTVRSDIAGAGSATRHHVLIRDDTGVVRAWSTVHDRAAGRSMVSVVVDPELPDAVADPLAHTLFAWLEATTAVVGAERGVAVTQLDSGAFAEDSRQQRWLAAAALEHVRSWWQMSRPVDPAKQLTEPGPGVIIRNVGRDAETGLPLQSDLQAIHDVLETSFTDHFNYHEETFDEFVSRLREDPGHRWDHWWIAELVEQGRPPEPAGALVGAVSPGDGGGPDSSYVEYLGVLRNARGRGVATSLLHAVFADAARRGRPAVGIEVDEDSSTGAAGLYLSMGFVTSYVTQSWHRDLPVPA